MRSLRRFIGSKWLSVVLAAIAGLCGWTIVVASELVPAVGIKSKYRAIAYDLSTGAVVSYFFYLLVVQLPEAVKRRRVARWLTAHYETFKLACIEIYLSAIGDSWESDLPRTLLQAEQFSSYFSEWHSPDQTRWHAVHNGLYDYGLPQLIIECELFAREIDFTLTKLDLEDDQLALFLKRLSRALVRLRTSTPNYDDIKALLNFLYPIHSHWSLLDGKIGEDPVADAIARM